MEKDDLRVSKPLVTKDRRQQPRPRGLDVEVLVAHPRVDLKRQIQLDAQLERPPQDVVPHPLDVVPSRARHMDPREQPDRIRAALESVD